MTLEVKVWKGYWIRSYSARCRKPMRSLDSVPCFRNAGSSGVLSSTKSPFEWAFSLTHFEQRTHIFWCVRGSGLLFTWWEISAPGGGEWHIPSAPQLPQHVKGRALSNPEHCSYPWWTERHRWQGTRKKKILPLWNLTNLKLLTFLHEKKLTGTSCDV